MLNQWLRENSSETGTNECFVAHKLDCDIANISLKLESSESYMQSLTCLEYYMQLYFCVQYSLVEISSCNRG